MCTYSEVICCKHSTSRNIYITDPFQGRASVVVYRALLLFVMASEFTDGDFTFLAENEGVYVFDEVVVSEEEYRNPFHCMLLSLYIGNQLAENYF